MAQTQVKDAYSIAVIAGDGIGPEVVAEALKVLDAVTGDGGPKFATTDYDLGARRWHATGEMLPDSVLDELRGHDAILLGAVGDPTVPDRRPRARAAAAAALRARPLRQPAPGPALPGRRAARWRGTPGDIDFVVVREGTEGPYAGNGGALRVGHPARGRHRGQRQHRVRRRAGRPRRLRPRRRPGRAST